VLNQWQQGLMLQELGADVAIDYRKERFEEVCAGEPFDAVLDLIAGKHAVRVSHHAWISDWQWH
jgi:NADPH:quinone reductase-like Zn-dependent oxidoreductase